jgi:DNA-directed RNA polymerase specialized sigma24 family protein
MKSEYATSDDFCKLFTEHMDNLYRLSFLLTANSEEAERCFVGGLVDCVDGNPVFKEWASSWARSIIVNNAIRIIMPHISPARSAASGSHSANEDVPKTPLQNYPFASVLQLEDFERFVYVLSVLERYPIRKCAVLLGTSLPLILETLSRALQHIAEFANPGQLHQQLASSEAEGYR